MKVKVLDKTSTARTEQAIIGPAPTLNWSYDPLSQGSIMNIFQWTPNITIIKV